jgi:hypothetical protein
MRRMKKRLQRRRGSESAPYRAARVSKRL